MSEPHKTQFSKSNIAPEENNDKGNNVVENMTNVMPNNTEILPIVTENLTINKSELNPDAEEFSPHQLETEVNSFHTLLNPVPLMYIFMELVGKRLRVKALLDSGTSVSTVCKKFLDKYNIPYKKQITKQLSGIGEANDEKVEGTVEFQLKSHSKVFNITNFIVIEGKNLDCDIVLGRKFCMDNKLVVDPKNRLINQMINNEVNWSILIDQENEDWPICQTINCMAAKDQVIRRQEMTEVPIRYELNEICDCNKCVNNQIFPWYYNGELSKQLNNIQGYDGLMSKDTQKVCVSNMEGPPELVLKKNTLLGNILVCYQNDKYNSIYVNALINHNNNNEKNEVDMSEEEDSDDWKNEVRLGDHLSEIQKGLVMQMIERQVNVVSKNDSDIGRAALSAHKIELYNYTPLAQKPRRIPDPITEQVEQQCQELNLLDIIEPSKSPWSAPIVPIKKKDGTIRLCVDYRQLNRVTIPDKHPMPNVADVISGIGEVKYFTTLDLVRGYYQMPVEETSRPLTAFSTTRGHWQFKRLPFGLKNSPSAFQREMQAVLAKFSWRKVLVYIDDILIVEDSFERHLELVRKVLHTLDEHGIKIKPRKCNWFQEEVKFLGHKVSADGISKTAEYMDNVVNFERPITVKKLRGFLGLINFQRKFIPHCSEIAKPLSRLTGQPDKTKILWTDEQQQAFEKLKEIAKEDLKLAYPDYSDQASPLELAVDASGKGAGACLSQWQADVHRVIAYISMTFSQTQQNYSTTERELAAIRWAVRNLKSYLYGTSFVVYSDHKPLIYLNNMKILDSRIARTFEDLADFDFEVRYRPGKDNTIPDILSRLHENSEVGAQNKEVTTDPKWLPEGLVIMKLMPGGGDSLFGSLHYILQIEQKDLKFPETVQQLRHQLVQILIDKSDHFGLKKTKATKQQLRLMQLPEQLPTFEILLVFSYLYNLRVYVHLGTEFPLIFDYRESHNNDNNNCIHLQCIAGIHFNPVSELRNHDKSIYSENSKSNYILRDQTINEPVDVNNRSDDEDVLRVSSFQCQRECKDKFVISVWVVASEQSHCALIDTGSQISIIRQSVWDNLPENYKQNHILKTDCNTMIKGFGTKTTTIRFIGQINLIFDERIVVTDIPVAVVPNEVLPVCILLGLNFVIANNIVFDYCRSGIYINYKVFIPMINVDSSDTNDQVCHVNVCETELTNDIIEIIDGDLYESSLSILTRAQILDLQKQDYTMRQVRRWLIKTGTQKNKCLKRYMRHRYNLFVEDGIIWFALNREARPVVPFKTMVTIAVMSHQQMGHIGPYKLKETISTILWHPDVNSVTKDITSTCLWCQKNKPNALTIIPPTIKIKTFKPFELVAVDLIALPRTHSGHVGCFVLVDHFSKWLNISPIKNKTGENIAKQFEKSLSCLPAKPVKCLSDNGPEFRSKEFSNILEKYSIEHILTTPYKPQSNGAVERVNRTVIQLIKALTDNPAKWDEDLAQLMVIYNQTFHEEIQCSPSQCLLQRSHQIIQAPLISPKTKQLWITGHPNFEPYKKYDWVLKKRETKGNLVIDKFKEKYEGPYQINKVLPNGVTYELLTTENKIIRAHYTQLRKVRFAPNYLKIINDNDAELFNICKENTKIVTQNPPVINNFNYDDWITIPIGEPEPKTELNESYKTKSLSGLDTKTTACEVVENVFRNRIGEFMVSRCIPKTSLACDFNLNETLHEQSLPPLTLLNTKDQLVQLPTQTFDLNMTTRTCLSTKDNDNDLNLDVFQVNDLNSKDEVTDPQSDQSAWLAEENNVILMSLNNKEKIVLSKVIPLPMTDNKDSSSEVELIPANINNKNNNISQVRIITENGQTFDFWNVSHITTTSSCLPLNKTINSEFDNSQIEQTTLVDQLTFVSEIMENISQQCQQISLTDLHSDKSPDPLGLTTLTYNERETLMRRIMPMVYNVRDLRESLNYNRKKAREKLLAAKRADKAIYSEDEFSGFQTDNNNSVQPDSPLVDNRPMTRSRGAVKDLPWTLPHPLEY